MRDKAYGKGNEASRRQDRLVVLLPSDKSNSRRFGKGGCFWWIAIPVLLLVSGIYGAQQLGWLHLEDLRRLTLPSDSAAGTSVADSTDPSREFRDAVDALEQALDQYTLRQSDFDQARIDCSLLTPSYERVDERFVTLSLLMAENGSNLGSQASASYQELSEEVDRVNRHFDASNCRVPR